MTVGCDSWYRLKAKILKQEFCFRFMNREERLAKNTFILSIGMFLPKLVTFITLPILTGYLTKEEMGMYDLIIILTSLVPPAVTLQIQAAALRFLIDIRDDITECKKVVSNIIIFIIPTSLLAMGLLFVLMPGDSVLKALVCVYYFFDTITIALTQIARGIKKNLEYSINAILFSAIRMVVLIVLVRHLGYGLYGAVGALVVSIIFSMFYLSIVVRLNELFDIKLYDKETIKELINYSWPLVPNSISMWIINMSDRFVVTYFMGLSANAVYSVANKLPSLLTLAQNTFTMAWHENASIASKDEDAENYYAEMFKTMFKIMAGGFGLLIAITPVLFKLLIRGDYSEAYVQIPILLMAIFFYCMGSFLGGIYIAYKETKSVGITTMCAAVLNLVINMIAIKKVGLYAASGSTLLSFLVLFIFRAYDLQRMIKISYNIKFIFEVLLILLIECLIFYQNKPLFNLLNAIIGVLFFWTMNKSLIIIIFKKWLHYKIRKE